MAARRVVTIRRRLESRAIPLETFFLGTHQPHWLRLTDVPLFLSRRRLAPLRSLPAARGPWALDSGGFTELSLSGSWSVTDAEYAAEARRYAAEVGRPAFCSPRDFMCEPQVLRRTGLTVREHQRLTIESYLRLRGIAPELPWVPVLQGWSVASYVTHAEDYRRAGIDLASCPVVGVGSVCRRQATAEVRVLLRALAGTGARFHTFGMKVGGLLGAAGDVVSADSMAWSLAVRFAPPLAGCPHRRCNNCLAYALRWRGRLLDALDLGEPPRPRLFPDPAGVPARCDA